MYEYKRIPIYRDIYRITMQSKTGKKLYLEVDEIFGLNKNGTYKRSYKWTLKKNNSMQFDTKEQAELFAKNYFKNFKNWNIDYSNEYDGCI